MAVTTSPVTSNSEAPDGRKAARIIGAILAVSAPLSGIIPFAVFSAILGEGRLEGADGFTVLGWMAMSIPVVVGLSMIAWSFTKAPTPSRRTLTVAALALAFVTFVTGVISLVTAEPGDASIGGGVLVLFALALGIIAGVTMHSSKL